MILVQWKCEIFASSVDESTMSSYLKIITPINLAEEKERFFASKDYSPQLEYNWDEQTLEDFLNDTPKGAELVGTLLSQDGEAIAAEAAKFFDVEFRPEDVALAESLIRQVPASQNGTAEEYAELMRRKLADLDIDYAVKVVDEHGFQGRPNHKKRILKLSKYLHLQFLTLDGITDHELVHIIRYINGEYNEIPVSDDYLPTEEGLACLVQDEFLVRPTPSSFQHALEYLAAHLSRTAGFREVYDFLVSHGCDAENAWLRGIRQKFGMRDTAQAGGLMKSGMYFYHENLLKNLSKDELLRLFVGKISLSEIDRYPIYTGEIAEGRMREFLGMC